MDTSGINAKGGKKARKLSSSDGSCNRRGGNVDVRLSEWKCKQKKKKKNLAGKVKTSTVTTPTAIYAPLLRRRGRTKQFLVTHKGQKNRIKKELSCISQSQTRPLFSLRSRCCCGHSPLLNPKPTDGCRIIATIMGLNQFEQPAAIIHLPSRAERTTLPAPAAQRRGGGIYQIGAIRFFLVLIEAAGRKRRRRSGRWRKTSGRRRRRRRRRKRRRRSFPGTNQCCVNDSRECFSTMGLVHPSSRRFRKAGKRADLFPAFLKLKGSNLGGGALRFVCLCMCLCVSVRCAARLLFQKAASEGAA